MARIEALVSTVDSWNDCERPLLFDHPPRPEAKLRMTSKPDMHTHQLQAQILACKDTYDVLEALGQASLDVRSLTASEEVLLFELIAEGMRVLGGSETSLSDRQLQQLATLIAARCQPHQAVVAAEALLTAFDNAFQAKLCEVFQGRGGRQTLKPGSPFPIAAHDLKPFFGAGSFTPHPSAFGLPGRQRAYLAFSRSSTAWR